MPSINLAYGGDRSKYRSDHSGNCWCRRTPLEKNLIKVLMLISVGVLIGLLTYLALNYAAAKKVARQPVTKAGLISKSMNVVEKILSKIPGWKYVVRFLRFLGLKE